KSADAIIWDRVAIPQNYTYRLGTGFGLLFSVNYNGTVSFTKDGTKWESVMPSGNDGDYFYAIAEGNGAIVAFAGNGIIYQYDTEFYDNYSPSCPAIIEPDLITGRMDLTFTASSTGPDEDEVYYRWDFGDGSVAITDSSITHRWLKGGEYTIVVTVFDG